MTNTEVSEPIRLNPGIWNTAFRYDQAQLRPAPRQLLNVAGQGSIAVDGELLHAGDTTAQMALAMANVEQLLAAADMDLRDVLAMTVHVTDMDAALAAYGAITERLDAAGATPPATLVEVRRLAVPGMTVEITVTAGR